ncbi:uncharacterized protein LOC106672045 [Cimex lectularius]|uniref:Thioredoxin domain-containing protein n=1 Tax=Cimex lectularius TaxID=79782 RepID=A0A8I6TH07_CIMLE|nr:uncharacterized protein LOC106672045 [Cimex lectularius]
MTSTKVKLLEISNKDELLTLLTQPASNKEMIKELTDRDIPSASTYIFFTGKKNNDLMTRAEKKLNLFLSKVALKEEIILIKVRLNNDQFGPGRPFGTDKHFRVYNIPKLIKWKQAPKLCLGEITNWALLRLMFESDILQNDLKQVPCSPDTLCPCTIDSDPDLHMSIDTTDSLTLPCGPLPRSERKIPPTPKLSLKKQKKSKKGKQSKKGKKNKKGTKGKKGKKGKGKSKGKGSKKGKKGKSNKKK